MRNHPFIITGTILLSLIAVHDSIAQSSGVTDLLRTLHVRPYGAGWVVGPAPQNARAKVSVSMLPGASPAGGMVLLRAGMEANDAKLIAAATDVARAIAGGMQPTGQIPSTLTFGPTVGGRDPATAIADRRATRAGVALLLTLIAQQQRDNGKPDERLVQSALRGASWLASQQSTIGGWATSLPPGKPSRESTRVILLDTEDFRDNTLTLLLAGTVLNKPGLTTSARKSVDLLIKMQLQGVAALNGRGLWSTAYNGDGSPGVKKPPFDTVVDTVASRRALETLLAFAIVTDSASDDSEGARALKNAITLASRTLGRQRGSDGTWERTWDPKAGAWQGGDTQAPPESTIFASTQPAVNQKPRPGTFGLPHVLDCVTAWSNAQTGKPVPADINFDTLPLDLAAALTGLTDLPFGPDPTDTQPAATSVEPTAFVFQVQEVWNTLQKAGR